MRLAPCLALALAACAHGPQPLSWVRVDPPPLSPPSEERTAFLGERIRFEVVDQRDEGRVVFRDGDRSFTTPDDIAGFYSRHLLEVLAGHGLRAVEREESLVVRLSVRRALGSRGAGSWGFKNYCGELLVLLESRRPQDPAFARVGEVLGSSLRLGSGDADSYSEAMAGAVVDAAQRLLEDRDLLRMLVNPEPAPAAPAETGEATRKPVAPAASTRP